MNEEIKAREVRLISVDGEQVGIMDKWTALKKAEDCGLDLVEVAPGANPPVCRIMDYGKYMYEQRKKEKASKKRQHIYHVKEIKLRPKIEEHDYQFKAKHVKRFLEGGDKVKIRMSFQGRQMTHVEFGQDILKRLINELSEISVVEQEPKLEGRSMVVVLAPR
ncbi:MAG: translation initiation factor IF-3 [bacterium]|nr:translation initiation factor IF-3 [bacterium]